MTIILTKENYLDNDVAYLLGMILMRGTFHVEGDIRRLIIQFPYKLSELKSIKENKIENRETLLRLSLDDIRNRLQELLEVDLQTKRHKHEVQFVAVFTRNTMSWRNLRNLLKGKNNYLEFEIPDVILESPQDIKKDLGK